MYDTTFIAPGAFSQAYNTASPSREMLGGRRQTAVFESTKVEDVHQLINQARTSNAKSTRTMTMASKQRQHKQEARMASKRSSPAKSKTKKQTSPKNKSPTPTPKNVDRTEDTTLLVLPEAPTSLGSTLSSRASANRATQPRISSPGALLRRGSQVGTAPRRSVRQYRHPRDMEAALIDSEAKIALLEDKLDATTSVLRRTQKELLECNGNLEASNMKTNSLLLMVQELLQQVVEKREGRRFSETTSTELHAVLNAPTDHYLKNDDMKSYIDTKMNAIDDLLPKWTSLPPDSASARDGFDFDMESKMQMLPPPLPPGVQNRRLDHHA